MVDCGTQIRLPGARLRVGPGVARTENFRQNIVVRFDADYLIKAQEHSAGRNRAAWRLLAMLSFLRNYGAIQAGASVNWDRAHLQAMKGDQHSNAAHNLPCQILIEGQFPWLLVSGDDIEASLIVSELREGFGGVYIVPNVFNAADSISEAQCLRGALVDACAQAINLTQPIRREAGVVKRGVGQEYGQILLSTADMVNPSAGIDHVAVTTAFRTWIAKSVAAFDRAIAEVTAYGASSSGQDVSENVLYILQRYKRFSLASAAPSDAMLWELEESFWKASA